MVCDAFGLFRGWCRVVPSCLEYVPCGEPEGAWDTNALLCSRCRCLPQQHFACDAKGYDPHSEEQLRERRKYDERLLPAADRAAARKAKGDESYSKKNFRDAYQHYSVAIEADPTSHQLLGNRCQAYLKVGRLEPALEDAQRAVALAPEWPKGHYRLGCCLQRLERPGEAILAFESACQLDPKSLESRRALDAARQQQADLVKLQQELDKARKSTTRRQAYDAKSTAEYEAKVKAKKKGRIKEITEWSDAQKKEWEAQYEAEWQPPPGVKLLAAPKDDVAPQIVDVEFADTGDYGGYGLVLESNADGEGEGGGLLLEPNDDDAGTGGGGLMLEDNEDDEDSGGGGGGLMLEDNEDDEDGGGGVGGLMLEDNEDDEDGGGGGGLMLEDNEDDEDGDGGGGGGGAGLILESNEDSEDENFVSDDEDSEDDNFISDSEEEDERPPEMFEVGSTQLMLPPRNYTLVHEDGRLHKKDNFEPMSFGMQRVHYESQPEPVWVQTATARWIQSATEVVIIAWTVPKELQKSSLLTVSFAPRQVHVSAKLSGEVFLHGELENRIDPVASMWTTDGTHLTLTCVKQNLMLYDPNAKGQDADTHWHRLFTDDQFTERGMIDANYSDLPEHILRRNKMADLERKAKEEKTKEENLCPLCGKDVRFFCDCRSGDKDYERPLPEGWKNSKLGFRDPLFDDINYDMGNDKLLKPRPPPQPQPYRGA